MRNKSRIIKKLKTLWYASFFLVWMIPCSGLSSVWIHLERPNHQVSFQVEVAQTPKELEQGLMDRQILSKDTGMLFVFPKVQYVEFWMKNTYLSLDMIFIDQHKRVVQLYAQAKPLDLAKIKSLKPIKYVIEVAAGSIQNNNIQEGDLFVWK